MSIQSNINNTIGQAAMLATLNPAIQEMGETAKDISKLKNVEKQLDTLQAKSAEVGYTDGTYADGVILPEQRDVEQYNKLRAAHEELAGKFAGKGKPISRYYGKGSTVEEINLMIKKAEDQRQKAEAIQNQKEAEAKAAQEFRSKQIRDLIMNPNLEVNNGTGNDTRR